MFRRLLLKTLRFLDFDVRTKYLLPKIEITLSLYKHRFYLSKFLRKNQQEFALMERTVEEGDTVFDVGAHIGVYSRFLAEKIGSNGQVIAFEPSPTNRRYLHLNTKGVKNITVLPFAAHKESRKKVNFYEENWGGFMNSLVPDYAVTRGANREMGVNIDVSVIEVATITLDDYVAQTGCSAPTFMKIDVEGAEVEVLAGASCLLADPVLRHLLIESHDRETDVTSFLSKYGFRKGPASNQGWHEGGNLFFTKDET